MAISIVAGTKGLIQLGLSISDVALLIDQGKKFGNFVRVRQNDGDLFDLLNEVPEAVLKRRGLVEAHEMETKWSEQAIVHQGQKIKAKICGSTTTPAEFTNMGKKKKDSNSPESVEGFTWVMAAIVSVLDNCLPSSAIHRLLVEVFAALLNGDDDVKKALKIHLDVNIKSWRSFACARQMVVPMKTEVRKSLKRCWPDFKRFESIPQLNEAETQHMKSFLVWLLDNRETQFTAMFAMAFATAEALKEAKLHLCTDGNPAYEGQACVRYRAEDQAFGSLGSQITPISRGLNSRTLQISWPRNRPKTMIDTLGVPRHLEDIMGLLWELGEQAADELKLVGKADIPFETTKEIYYCLEEVPPSAAVAKRFPTHIGMVVNLGFPMRTQKIYAAVEMLLKEEKEDAPIWLQAHVAQDYLLRIENDSVAHQGQYFDVFAKYQALVFGFYYRLLEQILCFELVERTAFFHGIWGKQSTTLLAMCTQLCSSLQSSKATRAHILYMLSAMYNGRRKLFNANSAMPRLVGVLGSISVLALPLVRVTDIPEEIWKIAIVDLPIVDLVSYNSDGELMAGEGGGLNFMSASDGGRPTVAVQPASPAKRWTVHSNMSMALDTETSGGVVMAAQCGGRLIGWFNPLAADILFLSDAYVRESYGEGEVRGFEVEDKDWQCGLMPKPNEEKRGYQFGLVHSSESPELRYAAAGFYGEKKEEVAIARSAQEIYGAFGRVEAQEQGIVIA